MLSCVLNGDGHEKQTVYRRTPRRGDGVTVVSTAGIMVAPKAAAPIDTMQFRRDAQHTGGYSKWRWLSV